MGPGLVSEVRNHVPAGESREQAQRQEVFIIQWRQPFEQAAMARATYFDVSGGPHLKMVPPVIFSARCYESFGTASVTTKR